MEDRTTNSPLCEGAPRDRANGRRIMLWSLAWAGSLLLASAVIAFEWFGGGGAALYFATLSALMGAGTVRAYRRFLRETDELRQKIELEALAVALGVGVVGGLAYSQIIRSLDLGEPRLAVVLAGMLIAHSIGVIVGKRRYA